MVTGRSVATATTTADTGRCALIGEGRPGARRLVSVDQYPTDSVKPAAHCSIRFLLSDQHYAKKKIFSNARLLSGVAVRQRHGQERSSVFSSGAWAHKFGGEME